MKKKGLIIRIHEIKCARRTNVFLGKHVSEVVRTSLLGETMSKISQ